MTGARFSRLVSLPRRTMHPTLDNLRVRGDSHMTVTDLNLMRGAPASIDVDAEIDFWRRAYRDHPAFSPRRDFSDYELAIRIGIEAFVEDSERTFEDCRDTLEDAYEGRAGSRRLHWYEAGYAAAPAWHRRVRHHPLRPAPVEDHDPATRSDEHTSELQSLM